MKCSSCGYDNDNGSLFCANCGKKIEIIKYRCPCCGSEIGKDYHSEVDRNVPKWSGGLVGVPSYGLS